MAWKACYGIPERPHRASESIFGAIFVQKNAIVAHEIPKAAVGILGMVDVGQVGRDMLLRECAGRMAGGYQHQKQGPRVIIQAIAFMTVRYSVDRMLADARAVGEPRHVVKAQWWQIGRHSDISDGRHHDRSYSIWFSNRSKI